MQLIEHVFPQDLMSDENALVLWYQWARALRIYAKTTWQIYDGLTMDEMTTLGFPVLLSDKFE